jgi:hypothetical protein
MKNKMDDLLREKINNLDTVPPGLSRDNEANWEKIKKNQEAIARKTDFVKKAAWGIIFATVLTGVFLFYGFEGSEEVRKAESATNLSPASGKTDMQLKEQITPAYVKPDFKERKTSPVKASAPRSVPGDTSMKIIAPITAIKPSADKQKEVDTIKTHNVPEKYPSPIGNTLEEDFRLDTFLKKDFLQDVQENNKAMKDRNDKKKDGLFGKRRKAKLRKQ